MNYKPLLTLTFAVLAAPVAFTQNSTPRPGEKPLSETDLLKQIESLTPSRPAARNEAPASSLFDANDPFKLGKDNAGKPGDKPGLDKPGADNGTDKKTKGPTEITALEATFDQKANLAIFIGEVVVKDPEFNVVCDKLTAHLKHDDKTKPGTAGAAATPKPATPAPKPGDPPKAKGGGLEKALAETTSDRRVIITQDKLEADGTITHSIGKSDRATYDAVTGDVVLYGNPDVIQGTNHVQSTDVGTVMTLNRDGHMKAVGPHKTTIIDTTRQ